MKILTSIKPRSYLGCLAFLLTLFCSCGGSDESQSKTIDDGSYTATVEYSNPNTSYSATYTLSVDVSNGQVVQINFPNDGYLDEDHITPADIDEDGNASVEGEEGKTYDIHIDL